MTELKEFNVRAFLYYFIGLVIITTISIFYINYINNTTLELWQVLLIASGSLIGGIVGGLFSNGGLTE